jgi:hypothetical protein
MPYDYTDAPPPPKIELIPAGTIATVSMHIDASGAGEDGMCKRSGKGDCEMLVVEFTVVDGEFKRRKFWQNFVLSGTTDGHEKAKEISLRTLKAIVDSAFNLQPNDISPEARARRTLSLRQFEGMTCMVKVGIEKGGLRNDGSGESYTDKNVLAAVITPDKREYRLVEQPPPFNGGPAASTSSAPPQSAPPIRRPGWAS